MNQPQDVLTSNDVPQAGLPSMLNVLTILTFIGSALGVITAFTLKLGCKVLQMDEIVDKMKEKEVEVLQKTCDNYLVIMIITLVGALLCFAGAYMMRKLKKQGFVVYVLGVIMPVVASAIIIGGADMTDWKQWIVHGLSILFIGLYASQRKYLVN